LFRCLFFNLSLEEPPSGGFFVMASREFAIAFSIAGQMSSTFQKSFQTAGNIVSNCGKQMQALNSQLKDVSGMMHQKAVDKAALAHRARQRKAKGLCYNENIFLKGEWSCFCHLTHLKIQKNRNRHW